MNVRFGDQATLRGYSLGEQVVAAGDVLPLTLFWQADRKLDRPTKVFVHLVDQRGQIVAQHDGEPVGGLRPTTSWQPGEVIADRVGLLIPFGTPPGKTQIVAGLYDAQTGQRIIPASGPADGRVPIATLDLARPAVAPPDTALGLQNTSDARFGALELLGYSRFKLGAEHDPSAPLYPGDTVHLVLAWQALEARPDDVKIRLSLTDDMGRLVAERITRPLDGAYPLAGWQSGEVVRDSQLLPLPPDLPVGRYRLGLEVQRAADGARLGSPLPLGEVRVE